MESIQIQQRLWWRCPNCRKGNFIRRVPVELSQEEREALEVQLGCSNLDAASLSRVPDVVYCKRCELEYVVGD